jgi:hypothetical protein
VSRHMTDRDLQTADLLRDFEAHLHAGANRR